MKVISKKISRNEFVSRKNGVIPSLMDMWIVPSVPYDCNSTSTVKKYVYSTYSSAVQKANELGISSSMIEYKGDFVYQDHNYGLVISDIIIPQSISTAITDYTDVYVNIPDGNGGYYDLNDYFSCVRYDGRKIISGGTFIDVKGNTIGKVYPFSSCTCFSGDCDEEKLKEEISKGNVILTGGTEVKILSYATLNKWYTFFKEYEKLLKPYYDENCEKQHKYSGAVEYYETEYQAKNDANKKRFTDLDDLFKARGSWGMYNWIIDNCMPHDNDYDDITCNDKEVKDTFSYATNSASYVIPILFTNSIDDLGEMAIFSSKWKDGVDYSDTLDKLDTDNVSDRATPYSGSTVIYQPYYKDNDGDVITIQEAYVLSGITNKGYEQNGYYENVFVENQWANYTDYMIASGNSEFASYSGSIFDTKDHFEEVTAYAFSPVNGNIIYNPQPGACESETINYIDKRFVVINDELVDVIHGDYVEPNYSGSCVADLTLKTGKAIPVINDGPLKYAELNGKKFYAVKEGSKYYIYFLNSLCCNDIKSEVIEDKDYIIYDNNLFVVSGNTVEIGKGIYKEVYDVWCGYFVYNGMTYFIDCTPKVLIDDDTKRRLGWASVTVNSGETVTICHKLDVKQANIVSGYTESKLELLRRRKINTDELGNELPGFIDFDFSNELTGVSANLAYDLVTGEDCEGNINAQFVSSDKLKGYGTMYNIAYDRCILDLLYVPGQFSDLEYQKTVTISGEDVALYSGNYLDNIEFYHLNDWGEKIHNESVEKNSKPDSRPIAKKYFNSGEYYDPNKPVYCDITYYIGATIEYDGNKYKPSSGRHEGVKYVETFTVNKLIGSFFMSDNTTFPFFYYELRSNKSGEELDDFNDVKLINLSYFEMKIMTFGLTGGTRTSGNVFNEDYWVKNNGMVTSPVFRSEYNLFSSTPQKEDDNIYIDRGINAAFESHLKLLETHTLESLENYSNGYFKINEY